MLRSFARTRSVHLVRSFNFNFCAFFLQFQFPILANYLTDAVTVFQFWELILYRYPVGW